MQGVPHRILDYPRMFFKACCPVDMVKLGSKSADINWESPAYMASNANTNIRGSGTPKSFNYNFCGLPADILEPIQTGKIYRKASRCCLIVQRASGTRELQQLRAENYNNRGDGFRDSWRLFLFNGDFHLVQTFRRPQFHDKSILHVVYYLLKLHYTNRLRGYGNFVWSMRQDNIWKHKAISLRADNAKYSKTCKIMAKKVFHVVRPSQVQVWGEQLCGATYSTQCSQCFVQFDGSVTFAAELKGYTRTE